MISKSVFTKSTILLGILLLSINIISQDLPPKPEEKKEEEKRDHVAGKFVLKCSGCHTIGGGKLSGPDLIVSITWPEADIAKNVKKMEKNVGPLTDQEIDELVKLLKDPIVKERLEKEKKFIMAQFMAKLDPPSVPMGEKLFKGNLKFTNNGMACISCHKAGNEGGSLGLDLTNVFAKLGKLGLISAIEGANFKIMKAAYKDHIITKQEAIHLTAFLESLGNDKTPLVKGIPLEIIGSALAVLTIILIFIAYNSRNKGVRARLVRIANRR